MLNRAQIRDLAQDLQIVIATGEYTRDGAVTLLTFLSLDVDFATAERILDQESPMGHANSYVLLPDGDLRPERGAALIIWERTRGDRKGEPYLPTLISRHPHVSETFLRGFAASATR